MGKIGEGAIEKRALAFFSVVAINSNLSTTGAKVIIKRKRKQKTLRENYGARHSAIFHPSTISCTLSVYSSTERHFFTVFRARCASSNICDQYSQ